MQRLNVIFAGTPEFAAQHLRFLLERSHHQIVAVYTQPDRPSGRGKKRAASAVKDLAVASNIPTFQPGSLKEPAAQRQMAGLNADIMVVVAYGLILPQVVLAMPRFGCINVHGSLLPRWRGAAPIQRAIEAGDSETGITIMQMDEGLDTGPMLSCVSETITDTDTAGTLQDKLAVIGAEALLTTLDAFGDVDDLGDGKPLVAEHQDDTLATYAPKLTKQEARLDWSLSASTLDLKIRAFHPVPVAHATLGTETVRVWQARVVDQHHEARPGTILSSNREGILVACKANALLLTEIQLSGKRRMAVSDVLQGRGALFEQGKCFGD